MNKDECCPMFDPTLWDGKLFEWSKKKFIKEKVSTFFNMPIHFGKVMKKLDQKVRDAQAEILNGVCLLDHTSKWNMNIYAAVDMEIPGAENMTLSGKFLTKVYEGSFRDTEKWCKDFEIFSQNKGLTISKWYMWYTTCPKCAKKYGKNYVVILAQVT